MLLMTKILTFSVLACASLNSFALVIVTSSGVVTAG